MKETIKSRFKIFGFKLLKVLGITSLFTSFGIFISCPMYGPPVAMYGAPVPEYGAPIYDTPISISNESLSYFTLDCTVTDANNNPIKGISVKLMDDMHVTTDENGKFHFYWSSYDSAPVYFTLSLEDVDGEENGSYENRTMYVKYSSNDYIGKTAAGDKIYEMKGKTISLSPKEA